MKYLIINKKTKQVKMICESIPEYDKNVFYLKEKDLSNDELDNINNSISVFWSDDGLIFIKKKEKNKKEIKEKLKKAKNIDDIKDVISDILD